MNTRSPRARPVRPFGDGALVAPTTSAAEAHGLARAVREQGVAGVDDVVVGHRSVTVIFDPGRSDMGAVAEAVAVALAHGVAAPGDGGAATPAPVEMAVAFDGPDLDEVAARADMTRGEVVAALTGVPLTVAMLGFLPGFAYLEGLVPALAAVPRRATPRTAVAPGSVGVAGGFAGIYPQASPGGWQLVGRTARPLFDPTAPPYAVVHPGDRVQLRAVGHAGLPPLPGPRLPLRASGRRRVVVVSPGVLSMVQDRGRSGVASVGVPRAGAADPDGHRAANRLVGNDDDAAVIEVSAAGPSLRLECDAHAAVVGHAEVRVDGAPVAPDAVVPLAAGQVLAVGTTGTDLRCSVALSGGVDVPTLFGSRSSDTLTGLGTGPLRAGDALDLDLPRRPRGRLLRAGPGLAGARRLRVMAGPDDFPPEALDRLVQTAWSVGASSNRMGVRLDGPPLLTPGPVPSRAMVTGAVQVPPDGHPVVLGCDHATVGGYPVIAAVILADHGVLGRCRPGDSLRFEVVDGAEAVRAREEAERRLGRAVVGWYPDRAG